MAILETYSLSRSKAGFLTVIRTARIVASVVARTGSRKEALIALIVSL